MASLDDAFFNLPESPQNLVKSGSNDTVIIKDNNDNNYDSGILSCESPLTPLIKTKKLIHTFKISKSNQLNTLKMKSNEIQQKKDNLLKQLNDMESFFALEKAKKKSFDSNINDNENTTKCDNNKRKVKWELELEQRKNKLDIMERQCYTFCDDMDREYYYAKQSI